MVQAWLRNWFVNPSRKPGKSRPRAVRPVLEALEDRSVPTVNYYGGALLSNVKVQGLYIGDQWSANPTLYGQTGYLEGYLGNVVNSPFMDLLANDGYNVGRGSAVGGKISLASLASTSYLQDSTIRSWIQSYITSGVLQQPDANTLYVCFVEPNVAVQTSFGDSISNFLGYHGAYAGKNSAGQARDIRYAVVTYGGGSTVGGKANATVWWLNQLQQDTEVASHEIAEAATDPDVNYKTLGWYDYANNGEVGDITNASTYYMNGYAVQRISDKNDQAMTAPNATANTSLSFVLTADGSFYKHTGAGLTLLTTGVASLTDQSIDFYGNPVADVVLTNGDAWEYHEGWGWRFMMSNVGSAVAGQGGVSYLLDANGNVYRYNFLSNTSTQIDSGDASIDAGTDQHGVNAVGVITTTGDAWLRSDSDGWHYIDTNVVNLSVGRQGILDYVTGDANQSAWWFNEANGAKSNFATGVQLVTTGTDQNGNYMIDVLFADGTAQEYRSSTGAWTYLWSDTTNDSVVGLGKGRLGLVDVVFLSGDSWEHTGAGYTTYLSGNTQTAV